MPDELDKQLITAAPSELEIDEIRGSVDEIRGSLGQVPWGQLSTLHTKESALEREVASDITKLRKLHEEELAAEQATTQQLRQELETERLKHQQELAAQQATNQNSQQELAAERAISQQHQQATAAANEQVVTLALQLQAGIEREFTHRTQSSNLELQLERQRIDLATAKANETRFEEEKSRISAAAAKQADTQAHCDKLRATLHNMSVEIIENLRAYRDLEATVKAGQDNKAAATDEDTLSKLNSQLELTHEKLRAANDKITVVQGHHSDLRFLYWQTNRRFFTLYRGVMTQREHLRVLIESATRFVPDDDGEGDDVAQRLYDENMRLRDQMAGLEMGFDDLYGGILVQRMTGP